MFTSRLLIPALFFVHVVVQSGFMLAQVPGRGVMRPDLRGVLKSADISAGKIIVAAQDGRQAPSEKTYTLAKDVEIALGDGGARRGMFLYKEGKLSDLQPGAQLTLTLSQDQSTVESIAVDGPSVRGVVKEVKSLNPREHVLHVTLMSQRDQEPQDKSYEIAGDAEIVVDDGRGRRLSLKAGQISDLVPGTTVMLSLSLDQKQVLSVQAEGPMLQGAIKSVDAAKNEVALTVFPRRGGEEIKDRTIALASDAVILLDDGRGRRLSLKEGKLSDIPAGSNANLRLTADQKLATVIRAEGAILNGMIRSVDAGAGTVTIVQRTGRGENSDEKTIPVAKDARVMVDGVERSLADIKVSGSGSFAMLRLTLDQKTVQSIFVNQPR